MWHFSMQGLPECMITHTSCELLPHIFTLSFVFMRAQTRQEVIFCGTVCSQPTKWAETRLFTGALLFAVRTFLLSTRGGKAIARPVASVNLKRKIHNDDGFHQARNVKHNSTDP